MGDLFEYKTIEIASYRMIRIVNHTIRMVNRTIRLVNFMILTIMIGTFFPAIKLLLFTNLLTEYISLFDSTYS